MNSELLKLFIFKTKTGYYIRVISLLLTQNKIKIFIGTPPFKRSTSILVTCI